MKENDTQTFQGLTTTKSPFIENAQNVGQMFIHQPYELYSYDRFQPLLFIVESFEHLYEEVKLLEEWLLSGKLDNVSRGKPEVSEDDLQVFFQHGNREGNIQ